MSPPERRPTLADVARLAGTSTAVVSYVINNGPRPVAPETQARVQHAIDELQYRRNRLAGALVTGHSNLVGLLVPDTSNAFFSELAQQIEQEGKARGLLTLLGNTAYDSQTEVDYENAISDLQPRGIFVTSIAANIHTPGAIPLIYLHSKPTGAVVPSVTFDDVGGGARATEHLLEHGLTNIHCITGPDDFGPSGRRARGWEIAMAAAGIPCEGRIHRARYDRIDAEPVLRDLLSRSQRPAAIFATTDEQAVATLRAANLLGLNVPEELAVVGMDGIREALYGSTRLTTISLPVHELAIDAFDLLELEEKSAHRKDVVLAGSLIVGETCGCPSRSSSLASLPSVLKSTIIDRNE